MVNKMSEEENEIEDDECDCRNITWEKMHECYYSQYNNPDADPINGWACICLDCDAILRISETDPLIHDWDDY